MRLLTLDVKRTHESNPACPSRVIPTPDGLNWQCIDCGHYILQTAVPIKELDEAERRRDQRPTKKPGDLVD